MTDACPKRVLDELPLYMEVSDSTFDILTIGRVYLGVKIAEVFDDGIAIVDDSGRRALIRTEMISSVEINEAAKKQKIRGDR